MAHSALKENTNKNGKAKVLMKTALTKNFENSIYFHFRKTGFFIAFEILFGFHQQGENLQFADVAIYGTNKELTCFEIKVSKSDFHSKAKKTFVGNKNYYAMPMELYEQVKNEIPEEIGVYSYNPYFTCVKKAKRIECLLDENTILWSFIRSRNNQTTEDVRDRTTISEEILDAFHKHLQVVDIEGNLKDKDKIEWDDNVFIELYVSQEMDHIDFYNIIKFMKNYTKIKESEAEKDEQTKS